MRYPILHSGLIRSILSEIGEVAGIDALYWRGLCAFEAGTQSRLLIEEEMTGDWQGAIHVRTQNGEAAILLQKAVEVIERIQSRLAMRPTVVERSSPPVELSPNDRISTRKRNLQNLNGMYPMLGMTALQKDRNASRSSTSYVKPQKLAAAKSCAIKMCRALEQYFRLHEANRPRRSCLRHHEP